MYISEKSENDPAKNMQQHELEHIFYSFCSFICMSRNKKMNMANIFIHILENQDLKELYCKLADMNTKYEAVRSFLTIEPSLQKSKYIKRYINKNVEN